MAPSVAAVLLILAAAAPTATADPCVFNQTQVSSCPSTGQPCGNNLLCAAGFCGTTVAGAGASFSGTCSSAGPSINKVYLTPCTPGQDAVQCQFQDPVAMNPRLPPSYLRCGPNQYSTSQSTANVCQLGLQKHGDGCTLNGECASNYCMKGLNVCQGIAGKQMCTATTPDPCQPGYYCVGGSCVPSPAAGMQCSSALACSRGSFCAASSPGSLSFCTAMFSVAAGLNTTVGPYMCASGNALMVVQAATPAQSVFMCIAVPAAPPAGASMNALAPPCSPAGTQQPGYTCSCAIDNTTRLTTIGGVGLGARAQTWQNLYQCLMTAKGTTGLPCQFDAADMDTLRYGSCAYYACYPFYLQLATITGARFLAPPLSYFDPSAPCEQTAAAAYYAIVAATPCITLPGLESWLCSSGSRSLSLAATNGVVSVVFILVVSAYLFHLYHFRKFNHNVFPCKRLNE